MEKDKKKNQRNVCRTFGTSAIFAELWGTLGPLETLGFFFEFWNFGDFLELWELWKLLES